MPFLLSHTLDSFSYFWKPENVFTSLFYSVYTHPSGFISIPSSYDESVFVCLWSVCVQSVGGRILKFSEKINWSAFVGVDFSLWIKMRKKHWCKVKVSNVRFVRKDFANPANWLVLRRAVMFTTIPALQNGSQKGMERELRDCFPAIRIHFV